MWEHYTVFERSHSSVTPIIPYLKSRDAARVKRALFSSNHTDLSAQGTSRKKVSGKLAALYGKDVTTLSALEDAEVENTALPCYDTCSRSRMPITSRFLLVQSPRSVCLSEHTYPYDLKPSSRPAPLPPSLPPSPPPGRYVTLGLFANVWAISRLASILLIIMSPSPAFATALLIVSALSASPSARMTLACRSCSAFSTMNRDRSASCWAICFCSTARVNSFPNVMWVMETSSSAILNSEARFNKSVLIRADTASRCVISSAASNCATIALRTSLPIDGRTRSS